MNQMTDITRKKRYTRETLLLTGMGLFVFVGALTAVNVILLPIAREYHRYSAGIMFASLMSSGSVFFLLGRKLRATREDLLKRAAKTWVPAYLAALFLIQLLMGYALEYTPSGDNFMLYNAAQMLASDGNFDAYPDFYLYLSRFSNQWGFMLMLSALYKLLFSMGITELFFPTVLLQAALYTAGVAALFLIVRRLRGARGMLSLLSALIFFFPLYFAAAVLYTDTFSMPFVAIALLFALRALDAKTMKHQLLNALACVAFSAVGGQIKMTVAIALIAACIVFVLRMKRIRSLVCCAAMILVMGLSVSGVRCIMVGPLLSAEMVAQHHTPTIHWIMMSIPNGNNPYGDSIEDYRQTWTMMENGAPREEVMASIYTRLIDKIYYLRYPSRLVPALLRKNAVAFGDGTLGLSEILDDNPVRHTPISDLVLEGGKHYNIYRGVCSGVFFAHMIFALLACLLDMKRRDFRAAPLYIAALGLILFMLIWEVRSRYIFNFAPLFVLLGVLFTAREKGGESA